MLSSGEEIRKAALARLQATGMFQKKMSRPLWRRSDPGRAGHVAIRGVFPLTID